MAIGAPTRTSHRSPILADCSPIDPEYPRPGEYIACRSGLEWGHRRTTTTVGKRAVALALGVHRIPAARSMEVIQWRRIGLVNLSSLGAGLRRTYDNLQ